MTGPTFSPDWSHQTDNPDFEWSVYSERMRIPVGHDLTGLVSRAGKPVVIRSMSDYYASGSVGDDRVDWYVGRWNAEYITIVEHADAPSENDVMLPRAV
jgi:hypothetical protein